MKIGLSTITEGIRIRSRAWVFSKLKKGNSWEEMHVKFDSWVRESRGALNLEEIMEGKRADELMKTAPLIDISPLCVPRELF